MGHFYKVVDMASRRIRYFRPCENGHYNWKQLKWLLSDARWYASNQILPAANDRVILVGGRGSFIYEFVPKLSSSSRDKSFLFHSCNVLMKGMLEETTSIPLPFLGWQFVHFCQSGFNPFQLQTQQGGQDLSLNFRVWIKKLPKLRLIGTSLFRPLKQL